MCNSRLQGRARAPRSSTGRATPTPKPSTMTATAPDSLSSGNSDAECIVTIRSVARLAEWPARTEQALPVPPSTPVRPPEGRVATPLRHLRRQACHHRHRIPGLVALRNDPALPRLAPATAPDPTVASGARLLRFVRHPRKCPLILDGHLRRADPRAQNLPNPRKKGQTAYARGLPLTHRLPDEP